MRRESAHGFYSPPTWPECESLWAPEEKRGGFEAEIKKISARNKTKNKNSNRKYVRHWRLSRLFTRDLIAVEKNEAEFYAQPRVQRLAWKGDFFCFEILKIIYLFF